MLHFGLLPHAPSQSGAVCPPVEALQIRLIAARGLEVGLHSSVWRYDFRISATSAFFSETWRHHFEALSGWSFPQHEIQFDRGGPFSPRVRVSWICGVCRLGRRRDTVRQRAHWPALAVR